MNKDDIINILKCLDVLWTSIAPDERTPWDIAIRIQNMEDLIRPYLDQQCRDLLFDSKYSAIIEHLS